MRLSHKRILLLITNTLPGSSTSGYDLMVAYKYVYYYCH